MKNINNPSNIRLTSGQYMRAGTKRRMAGEHALLQWGASMRYFPSWWWSDGFLINFSVPFTTLGCLYLFVYFFQIRAFIAGYLSRNSCRNMLKLFCISTCDSISAGGSIMPRIFRIHGDNIVECERIAKLILEETEPTSVEISLIRIFF